jgi:hypothetical protein
MNFIRKIRRALNAGAMRRLKSKGRRGRYFVGT